MNQNRKPPPRIRPFPDEDGVGPLIAGLLILALFAIGISALGRYFG